MEKLNSKSLLTLLICFTVVIVTSCADYRERNERDLEEISEVFRPYVKQFLIDAENHGRKIKLRGLKVEFSEGELYSNGKRCHGVYYSQGHKILIWGAGKFWKQSPKALLYHELGHGLLDRDHKDEVDKHHQPLSVMYIEGITDYALDHRNEYYLEELFTR